MLPYGPRIGLGALRTGPGRWALGPGLLVLVALGGAVLLSRLRRRRAPWWAYAALAGAAVLYVLAFASLRTARLERTHLLEYGLAALLAWRALAPTVQGSAGYLAAALVAGAVGYGDELLQAVVPGRHYDIRDVGMNVLGAVLGVVVLAAARAGGMDAASQSGRPGMVRDAHVPPPPALPP